ncbi:MAG: anaerobic sulfatase maturase [Lysobacterales bacterium]
MQPAPTSNSGTASSQVTLGGQNLFRGDPVRRVHVMVKGIGSKCNLDCTYCYYLSKEELLGKPRHWAMSDETLETFIQQYFEANNYEEVVFTWQGGEPTVLGLDFFRKAVALEKKYCPPEVRCENDLQTNGTLLDDEWCRFLYDNRFLVGLSIDGPQSLHDAYRKDRQGRGSFQRTFKAARLLRKHKVNFAVLCCVNRTTAKHPLLIYRFLRDRVKAKRIQFIPIVEPVSFRDTAPQHWDTTKMPIVGTPHARPGVEGSVVEDWCVDPADWGRFLCQVFDEWYRKDVGRIYVNFFETAVETWMGHVSPLCILAPMCGKGLACERDGSVYSCDHYVYPEYRLGNIKERSLAEMAFSSRQEHFGIMKEGSLPQCCRDCDWQFACFGGCPKDRFTRSETGEPGLNYLCAGWKRFFGHIDLPVQRLVRSLGAEVIKQPTMTAAKQWVPQKKR